MREHDSYLEVVWTDPVTGRKGFVVIDCLTRGVSAGGLRMREGCTLDEVRDLARAMTLKESVVYSEHDRYIPFGGSKGGIDCSPYDPEARGVLARYARATKPLIETCFATGEDLGVRQEVIDEVFAAEGITSSVQSTFRLVQDGAEAGHRRLREAFAVQVDGVGLDGVVGGYGVAAVALETLEHLGIVPGESRAVIQGFGSMGGASARYLAAAGVRVVGIADVRGLVANPEGLDVEGLLLSRDQHGAIDRRRLGPGDRELPGDEWLSMDAELLVPAALSYTITPANCDQVRARAIVEAANCPTVPEAEERLAARGVAVIPDFVANVGTNAWWWWTVFGDIAPEAESSFKKIDSTLRPLTREMLARAASERTTPRTAATAISLEKRALVEAAVNGR
ncbi:Glu/Leu/Phe/Val dehydrogenase dimerization domain-containing protein [Sphaerisporangium flaviroseum]|uniref:Glutamate dehydrogenase n=1 Tax=Sphaerisporangium flaviroseum TaxID=509199 RepID=A0ABP7I3A7_9ACTN